MTEEEKVETIKYAVKKAAGRIKIIVGTGSNRIQIHFAAYAPYGFAHLRHIAAGFFYACHIGNVRFAPCAAWI